MITQPVFPPCLNRMNRNPGQAGLNGTTLTFSTCAIYSVFVSSVYNLCISSVFGLYPYYSNISKNISSILEWRLAYGLDCPWVSKAKVIEPVSFLIPILPSIRFSHSFDHYFIRVVHFNHPPKYIHPDCVYRILNRNPLKFWLKRETSSTDRFSEPSLRFVLPLLGDYLQAQ